MTTSLIGGCRLIPLVRRGDRRGSLVAMERDKDVPFEILRAYAVFDTGPGVPRGNHAHHACRQLALSVTGRCRMVLDDGKSRQDVWLDDPTKGLLIEPMVWHEMHEFSSDNVLLVLADMPYDEADYIRDYDNFMALARA